MVNNTRLSQYILDHEKNAVNYHVVREAAAAGILRVRREDTEINLADLMENILGWQ